MARLPAAFYGCLCPQFPEISLDRFLARTFPKHCPEDILDILTEAYLSEKTKLVSQASGVYTGLMRASKI
ncbi:unnamed protein product [Acanthoscelides obtectus]|uniref:Uncharacterized protein n=1 Tax=Acanthoscelides obtectus TaxID=200917 RepID=A0A9P0KML0_ACAOB|nr:unnamed protein product [Acanthoscelides obtectus]CAK1646977.1 hypothetical protein AOBTE_LOCUS14981 [Acanthoscelides obtectus]